MNEAVTARPTTVINVSRLTRDQRAALVADPNFAYVGRKFAGWPGSVYGNPFKVGLSAHDAREVIGLASDNHAIIIRIPELSGPLTAAQAVECYRLCWSATLGRREKIRAELRGKRLGCYCLNWRPEDWEPSRPCHAVILAKIADSCEIATTP